MNSVRPLALETIVLGDVARLAPDDHESVHQVLVDKVNEMIVDATREAESTGAPLPPLVRLKVEFSGGFR